MARVQRTETTGRIYYVDDSWSDSDVAFFEGLAGTGLLLTYEQAMLFYNWMLAKSGTITNLVVGSDGNTLTSAALAGMTVAAIGIDGTLRPPTDSGIAIWRKGSVSDDAAAQKASDTITLLNGFFSVGQVITILKGQS